jgi:NADPH:quinone reductase-like Zn-dependent oxidoreductase
MKVAFVPRYGPPEVVEFRELPDPVPGPGQVRIRLRAAAVTTGDMRLRSGVLPRGFGWLRGLALGFGGPRAGVLGTDAAGVVDAVGPDVTTFALGDEVVAFPGVSMGAHAELLLLPADGKVVPKPASLSFEEAVALPFGASTALHFLRAAGVKPEERVLVNGASGNVGSMAVQLARHMGAHVTGVCGGANAELVRSLGAAEVIDHREMDFTQSGASWDVVVDTVGNAPYARVGPVLKPGGRLLAVLADLPATLGAPLAGRTAGHRVIAGPGVETRALLEEVVGLAAAGELRAVVDSVLPFAEIVEAYRRVDGGRKRGSVVLRF